MENRKSAVTVRNKRRVAYAAAGVSLLVLMGVILRALWTDTTHLQKVAEIVAVVLVLVAGVVALVQSRKANRRFQLAACETADRAQALTQTNDRLEREIEARKRIELALRKTEEALQLRLATIEAAEDMVMIADRDGVIEYVNAAFTRNTGYTAAEAVGRKPSILKSGQHDVQFYEQLWGTILGGEVWKGQMINRRKDGTDYTEEMSITPIRNDEGKICRFVAIKRDITERKETEWQLRESELRFRQLAENIREVFWMSSADGGELFYVSPGYESVWGQSPDGLYQNPTQWTEAIHPEDRRQVADAFFEKAPQGTFDEVFRIIRPDGMLRWIRDRAFPIHSDGGQVVRIVGIAEDITVQKRVSLELEKYSADLRRTNQELDDFAYVASHDLKAPLRAIDSLAKWIVEDAGDKLPAECCRHIEKMQQRVRRMENLLTDLLHYSRAGRMTYEPELIEVAGLISEITEMVALPEGFQIVVGDEMPALVTPRPPLEQVFMNLITNAVKHHDKPAGRIEVSARELGEYYEFAVCDDGPGIDPRFHQRIFRMFQTLQPRDKVEGSGVGLAIIKKLVESYGGTVTVESRLGEGSTFRFTWPKRISKTVEAEIDEEAFACA